MRIGNCSCQATEACASCFSFFGSKAEDQLAVAVRDKILAVLPSEEDVTSLSVSRFKLKELRQSSIGNKCSRGHQAFIDLVDELVANLQVGLGLDSLHSGTVLHKNILNRAKVYQRVQLKDQDPKVQHNAGEDYDIVRHRSAETQVRQTRRESKEGRGRQIARVGGMPSFQVASQHGRRNGVGWLGEGFSQIPLFSE